MGYENLELRIPLRLDKHNGPEQRRDREAADDLKMEIAELIQSNKDYCRIALLGVEGGW